MNGGGIAWESGAVLGGGGQRGKNQDNFNSIINKIIFKNKK